MEAIAKAGDAVWQSNRAVAENVKTLKTAKKSAVKKIAKKKIAKKKTTKTKSQSRAALAAAAGVLRETSTRRAPGSRLPGFVPPQLASLHEAAPDGRDFVHEAKFDGYRIQARLEDGKVKLLTRKGLDWTAKFKPVARAVAQLGAESALIDGEIVVEMEGISDFSALQDALKHNKSNFTYYVFDLLHLDGADLTSRPLIERKAALQKLLDGTDRDGTVRYSEHFEITGSQMLVTPARSISKASSPSGAMRPIGPDVPKIGSNRSAG
jgi:bifunctional non-homologous end joining protein LigD